MTPKELIDYAQLQCNTKDDSLDLDPIELLIWKIRTTNIIAKKFYYKLNSSISEEYNVQTEIHDLKKDLEEEGFDYLFMEQDIKILRVYIKENISNDFIKADEVKLNSTFYSRDQLQKYYNGRPIFILIQNKLIVYPRPNKDIPRGLQLDTIETFRDIPNAIDKKDNKFFNANDTESEKIEKLEISMGEQILGIPGGYQYILYDLARAFIYERLQNIEKALYYTDKYELEADQAIRELSIRAGGKSQVQVETVIHN